jgi:lysosomal acid lipase/cholesteryl ester hydrolase
MSGMFQVSLALVSLFVCVFSTPLWNPIVKQTEMSSYYPSLNERIEGLKKKYKDGKVDYLKSPVSFDDPDCNRTALEIINAKNYAGEIHHVTTYDNYTLGIHRIPAPQNMKPNGSKKPAVLLWHGVGGCSVNWITNEANNSLGFMLADAGYDVWLGNSRGNTYSTAHKYLNTSDPRFWQFSWDHMAGYDLPATIDYILSTTGQTYLYYGGHSQGTLIAFAHFSSDVNYSEKIKAFFALAPVAHVGNVEGIEKKIAPYTEDIQLLAAKVGYDSFMPWNGYIHKLEEEVCGDADPDVKLCELFKEAVVGNADKLNQSRIGVIMSHCPAGTSTQDMVHFGQMVNSDLMQAFDYTLASNGTERNEDHYGQATPPIYPVNKLQVPTIVFHSDSDSEADPTDVAWLLTQISGTVVEDYHYTDYVHTDFIWALRAAEDVYPHIISYIRQQESAENNSI